jgi:hypothetical protein
LGSGATAILSGFAASQGDLNAVTVVLAVGATTTVTFGNLSGIILNQCSVYFGSGPGTAAVVFIYPELSGSTSATLFRYPIYTKYNASGAIQASTLITVTNASGTVSCQQTGLTSSTVITSCILF